MAGTVAFLNYELPDRRFRDWAAQMGVPADRLMVVNARGTDNPLGSGRARRQLATQLRDAQVESIIIDPFCVASVGVDANSPGEVRSWLTTTENWAREDVGAVDVILTAHAGWASDARARGASSLEDWPDTILNLRKRKDGRSLSALGRDVLLPELPLSFDPRTRLLHAAGASTDDSGASTVATGADDDLAAGCMDVVRSSPGLATNEIGDVLRRQGHTFRNGDENKALRSLVSSGQLRTVNGPHGARLHYAAEAPPAPPPL